MALLEVRGLVKKYGPRKVVDGVSFEVNPGEVVGLLGPNGAGKTTSFRMATGQVVPNEGEVRFDDQDVTRLPMYRRARLGMGYLSQEPSIFRKLSVEQNILAILEALPRSRTLGRKLTRAERRERTDAALARFKLEAVRHNPAARCSGGEKRRLEIARCLVCEPLLILLDEPLAAVDPLTKEDIRHNIRELANQGIGILLTDHDVREVLKIADRAYVIIDGKVVAEGTPEQLKRNQRAIDGYLGSTFADEIDRPPVVRSQPIELLPEPEPTRTPSASNSAASSRPIELPPEPEPPRPAPPPPYQPPAAPPPPPIPEVVHSEPEFELDLPPLPPPAPPKPAPATQLFGPATPGQFSHATQQLLEQEKLRRVIDQLGSEATWAAAWHELALRGLDAVPVLLDALERREPRVRHLAFRLLEQITGESLTFDANAPDADRLRQAAHLRARLDRRKAS